MDTADLAEGVHGLSVDDNGIPKLELGGQREDVEQTEEEKKGDDS